MKALRVIFADDEKISRSRLKQLLQHTPGVEIVAECQDGLSALKAARELPVDVLLLDVQMPGLDGLEVAHALEGAGTPAVIFTTVARHEAVRAFEVEAADFIVKPVTRQRLWDALARVRRRRAEAEFAAVVCAQAATAPPPENCFTVRRGGTVHFVKPTAIDWVEAAGNYSILHVHRVSYMMRETLSSIESQLPEERFLRVSRSAIVNLAQVREIQNAPAQHHAAVLSDGCRVPVTCGVRELTARIRAL